MDRIRLRTNRVASPLMVFAVVIIIPVYTARYLWRALARSSLTDSVLATVFPGFNWRVVVFTGLGWSILYSAYLAVVFLPAYNLCCRVCAKPGELRSAG